MITEIKAAAEAVGIQMVVTNSKTKLETQLNSLTRDGDSPIMLISWDITTTLDFDDNQFLRNPTSQITALLVTKSVDLQKVSMEEAAVSMGNLFREFIIKLASDLDPTLRTSEPSITNCSYQLVPEYGLGKHSGILGRWNMRTALNIC